MLLLWVLGSIDRSFLQVIRTSRPDTVIHVWVGLLEPFLALSTGAAVFAVLFSAEGVCLACEVRCLDGRSVGKGAHLWWQSADYVTVSLKASRKPPPRDLETYLRSK